METLTLEKETIVKTKLTGSEAVIKSLIAEDVETIFGYPGGAIMPIYDALYGYEDQLKHVLVRHEQGATHAAEGYARISNKTGVCFATSGPGATNLVTGLADAMIDSTPMVCITGQVPSHLLGTDAFQETDIIGISSPVTKWSYQVTKAEEIPDAIAKAFYIANTGRPGPVVIDITKNAQFEEFDFDYKKCTRIRSYRPTPKLNMEQVEAAVEAINGAKKPYILTGHGVLLSEATEELMAFAEKAGIPVASTILGLSSFPNHHRLYAGMLGMHGNYGPNIKTNECDVLIAIGMRFDDRVTGDLDNYAKQAKVVHIELDYSEINKNVYAHYPVHADAKQALTAMLPLLKEAKHDSWLQEFRDADKKEFDEVQETELNSTSEGLNMAEVIRRISNLSDGNLVLTTDVGQHQMVACRYYQFNEKNVNSNITSGGLGTMGFALPAAIGAKFARPDQQVIAVIGDGGFQMNIQELGTIMQEGLDVKILILNNNFLGMVRQWQELFFDKRYASTTMTNPDFITIAKGYGITGKTVDSRDNLDASLEEFLNHKGSYLLEVMVEKEGNVFPMMPTGASVSEVRLS
ncbi:biosynthetic-type acetolactate synthase large subunit [Flavobacteriales bacterium]|nr:biosynthetic-type acetolactate synthase large subunit [Flavobacteriales bacterium]MDC3220355.1 biosynthetic-type acetolactate synthase large subunit [Flavobacteriales bacterium]